MYVRTISESYIYNLADHTHNMCVQTDTSFCKQPGLFNQRDIFAVNFLLLGYCLNWKRSLKPDKERVATIKNLIMVVG